MNEQQARQECERLAREHPAREEFAWFPRQRSQDEWTVVRIPASGLRVDHGRTVATHDPSPARPNPELDPPVAPKPYWGGA